MSEELGYVLICSECGVNHVEFENREEEVCSSCLETMYEKDNHHPLDFEDRIGRRDDGYE